MAEMTPKASSIASKYVTQASTGSAKTNSPKRGLQAEINKVEAIRRVIGTKDFDAAELSRFKTVLNTLSQTIDFKIQNS